MPTISVIVPVYKVEAYLARCVDSLLSQTYSDFELILVDDGSPDSCPGICDCYVREDGRVKVIHKDNGGLSSARNAGLAEAKGDYISFVDSDDWVHPCYLEWMLSALDETGLKICVGTYLQTERETEIFEKNCRLKVSSPSSYWKSNNVNAVVSWGKFYSREICSDLFFPEGVIHEDEFTTHTILFKADEIAVVITPIYYYFQNPNGIMGKPWSKERCSIINALSERVDYFTKIGELELCEITRDQLIQFSYQYYFNAKEAKDEELTRKIKSRLRHELKKSGIPSKQNVRRFEAPYLLAFPCFSRLCLHSWALLDKIRLRFSFRCEKHNCS